jgi:outer membrane lipoprotein-sorting protein
MRPDAEEPFDDVQKLLEENYRATAPSEQFTNRLHKQLLTLLAAANGRPAPAEKRNYVNQWVGDLTVKQRISIVLSCAGMAAIVGCLLLWASIEPKTVSAMERMAENIRKAKSYTATGIICMRAPQPGSPAQMLTQATSIKVYWLAPNSMRTESKPAPANNEEDWKQGMGDDVTDIVLANKQGIHLNNGTKEFFRLPRKLGSDSQVVMDKLRTLSGQADKQLGTKLINGKKARGFVIDCAKSDPNNPPGTAEIWIDAESDLLLAVHSEMKLPGGMSMTMKLDDFHWNIDLDPKLFDPTPPQGYADETVKETPVDERSCQIAAGLRIYAEASGGRYPAVSGFAAIADLAKLFGIDGPVTTEQLHDAKVQAKLATFQRGAEGLGAIDYICSYKPDAAYYGKTVGTKDKDKVLLRWKLDDGRYEVIYGDLRNATVTAERLGVLECTRPAQNSTSGGCSR